MTCSEPLLYDEFCEEDGLCSRIECTGEGASWEMHFRVQAPVAGDVDYDAATIDTAWAEGDTGLTFVMASDATGDDGRDWSITASGRMDVDLMELEESYPGLVEGATTTLTMMETSDGGHVGAIAIDGEVVATPEPSMGSFVAVDGCR